MYFGCWQSCLSDMSWTSKCYWWCRAYLQNSIPTKKKKKMRSLLKGTCVKEISDLPNNLASL